MNYILFDGAVRNQLLPFTFTRPVADIRIGILTIREKWEKFLGSTTTTVTEEYLSDKFPMVELEQNVLINASFCPSENLVLLIKNLQENQAIFYNDQPLAFYAKEDQEIDFDAFTITQYTDDDVLRIENTWDIFEKNHQAIKRDYDVLTQGRTSEAIPQTTIAFNPEHIFIEKGAKVMCASLNATDGPIYIGEDTVLMEGATIQGPFALCEHSSVKMGAKIYGGTTIGPHCKVGGEVANSVMMGYSNKGHDGYMGNSVLGHWCNLGADTNTSNLKNNYAQVRLWDYDTERFAKTGTQFCGLMMGDHSKCGINTMFNTGTVVGVSANIFGAGYPRNFIPSFTWGGSSGMETYNTTKAFEVAAVVMARRGLEFDTQEEAILNEVFEISKQWRRS
ncbi:GlmU family protein [Flavobacteriaceae bacterium]|jgi:UDP-N-acetylglucosamine diphosphorylase/glucosamine-1-phosphate N-acetyltransferase|nr:GlmU family protein [Flavobacteriaceae bacterium]MDA9284210.1 GlmU family protein [Flavobacteriaceae bacterium]